MIMWPQHAAKGALNERETGHAQAPKIKPIHQRDSRDIKGGHTCELYVRAKDQRGQFLAGFGVSASHRSACKSTFYVTFSTRLKLLNYGIRNSTSIFLSIQMDSYINSFWYWDLHRMYDVRMSLQWSLGAPRLWFWDRTVWFCVEMALGVAVYLCFSFVVGVASDYMLLMTLDCDRRDLSSYILR